MEVVQLKNGRWIARISKKFLWWKYYHYILYNGETSTSKDVWCFRNLYTVDTEARAQERINKHIYMINNPDQWEDK